MKNFVRSVHLNARMLAWFSLAALLVVRPAWGADSREKSHYTLFNPTPKDLMREMRTDRPDKTESPYTVDAGHFQLEMDLVSYTHDRQKFSPGFVATAESWAVAPINLKVGLCNRVDFQVVLETWNQVTTELEFRGIPLFRSKQRGFGDVTTRLKVNLWGNDGGTTAFAAMPFVKLPTHQDELGNDSVEGGVILPLAVELPHGFGLGLMTELDFIRDGNGDGYHPGFINSITFSHDIVGDLAGYAEFFSLVSTERNSDWMGTVDLGLTYGLTDNLQLDAGVNIGVTQSADDLNPFVGLSWRF